MQAVRASVLAKFRLAALLPKFASKLSYSTAIVRVVVNGHVGSAFRNFTSQSPWWSEESGFGSFHTKEIIEWEANLCILALTK